MVYGLSKRFAGGAQVKCVLAASRIARPHRHGTFLEQRACGADLDVHAAEEAEGFL